MTHPAIKAIEATMTGLGLFERYGGLVRVAMKKEQISTSPTGAASYREKRFPISCDVTAKDCWEGGKFADLVPNSNKKAVAYWEELDGFRHVETKGLVSYFEAKVRFVFWANIPQLNLNGTNSAACSIAALMQMPVIKALHEKDFDYVTEANTKGRVRFAVSSTPRADATLFDRYTYAQEGINLPMLCLYPFEVGAIDFTIRLSLPLGCVVTPTMGTPDNCVF